MHLNIISKFNLGMQTIGKIFGFVCYSGLIVLPVNALKGYQPIILSNFWGLGTQVFIGVIGSSQTLSLCFLDNIRLYGLCFWHLHFLDLFRYFRFLGESNLVGKVAILTFFLYFRFMYFVLFISSVSSLIDSKNVYFLVFWCLLSFYFIISGKKKLRKIVILVSSAYK